MAVLRFFALCRGLGSSGHRNRAGRSRSSRGRQGVSLHEVGEGSRERSLEELLKSSRCGFGDLLVGHADVGDVLVLEECSF